MKLPVFGFNRLQSFIKFVSNQATAKLVLEGNAFYVEVNEVKYPLVDLAGNLTAQNMKVAVPLMTTPAPNTVTIEEWGNGRDMVTKLTLADFPIGTMPGTATAKGIGAIVAAFPAGAHLEESTYLSLSLKAPGTAIAVNCGLGSVVATGTISVLTGTATFIDRSNTTSITTGVNGGTAVVALKNTTAGVQTGIALNVEASVKNLFLNAAATWAINNGSGNLTATGVIIVKWTKMSA